MPANPLPIDAVQQLRRQGLTDDLIVQELGRQGVGPTQAQMAIAQADMSPPSGPSGYPSPYPSYPAMGNGGGSQTGSGLTPDVYGRIEEITENLIDEKWDDLLNEVKKIVQWKEKMEDDFSKMRSDVDKLKEDFKVLHEGVLGKLEDYDERMRDVDTELKAVGKVFKDTVPLFVENVKELGSIKEELRKK